MRRFFIEGPVVPQACITGNDVHHISRVLRMRPGDKLAVVFSGGQAGEAVIESLESDKIIVKVDNIRHDGCSEPPVDIYLAQCLPKGDKMDYIVQKAVELGACGIFPVVSAHCVVQYDDNKKRARHGRWQKIAAEAAKQCGRNFVPPVHAPLNLHDMLSQLSGDTMIIMLYEAETIHTLKSLLSEERRSGRYLILVGPEGGFSGHEAEQAKQYGAYAVTLGPRILRTETASLAALSILMYDRGDLGG